MLPSRKVTPAWFLAQFRSGISEELREKVFGVPNPPQNIEAALTATTAAEVKKTPTKMVIGVIEDSTDDDKKREEEDTVVERMVKQVEDVLAISKRQGNNSKQQRTREQGSRSTSQYSSYKCYNCGTMGHLRGQCNKPDSFLRKRQRRP